MLFCYVFVFCFVNLRWTALAYLWRGQLGVNPWAVAVEDFRIFSLKLTVANFKYTCVHKVKHTESKVARTKGQRSTVFRPWRSSYFYVASLFVWHVACERLLVSWERKVATGHCIVKRQGKEEEKKVLFCLVAHAYRSSTTLIKLSCKSLGDSKWRRLLSLPLQAKTTSELDFISLASSLEGNKFWFASTVVWLLEG